MAFSPKQLASSLGPLATRNWFTFATPGIVIRPNQSARIRWVLTRASAVSPPTNSPSNVHGCEAAIAGSRAGCRLPRPHWRARTRRCSGHRGSKWRDRLRWPWSERPRSRARPAGAPGVAPPPLSHWPADKRLDATGFVKIGHTTQPRESFVGLAIEDTDCGEFGYPPSNT